MNGHQPAFHTVFFDLGGTLFRYGDLFEPFNDLLLSQLRPHGLEIEADAARRGYSRAMEEAFRQLGREPYYLHSDLFVEGHRRFLGGFGLTPEPEAGLHFYRSQIELGVGRVEARAGAAATLKALAEAGLHIGIVSNIDDDQFHPLWERMGLSNWVHATTTSEEARSCKPDRGIFDLALRKAGGPDPSRCAFVGDSPFHDIVGANRLGMHSVLIRGSRSKRRIEEGEARPARIIRELPELLELLGS